MAVEVTGRDADVGQRVIWTRKSLDEVLKEAPHAQGYIRVVSDFVVTL